MTDLENKLKVIEDIQSLKEELMSKAEEIENEVDAATDNYLSFDLVVRDVMMNCIDNTRKELPFSLTPSDLIEMLPISSTKIYELLERGVIPGKKIGGKWAIPRDQFLAWYHANLIEDGLEKIS